ncbi:class I SAM-dependent methyltransferase [Massilia sp. Dwa41.01b]|uniref:class I SAM-dependent methyltransferase n=1 Tax=Massilia sp. Dwa41.01b TaxID=2709302 RepID=UPI0015FFDF99|nr:class I SAM-dependent methyltransferase [Massilia sp. Dwa41.01b]QNA88175.1 class I SAM-dependent methyltransferase [Massilia sp. Dwa41.01b]
METQVEVRKAVWSRYWSHGVAHSCGGSYGNRYDGALAHFWRSHFDSMSPGARMLDIATGNGAVPQLMLDSAPATVACDAIDLALPEPAWLADLAPNRRRQVRFHGQQAAESLPFADASFDLVTSQYGLEYTDLARSVPEVLRVLRPGARYACSPTMPMPGPCSSRGPSWGIWPGCRDLQACSRRDSA